MAKITKKLNEAIEAYATKHGVVSMGIDMKKQVVKFDDNGIESEIPIDQLVPPVAKKEKKEKVERVAKTLVCTHCGKSFSSLYPAKHCEVCRVEINKENKKSKSKALVKFKRTVTSKKMIAEFLESEIKAEEVWKDIGKLRGNKKYSYMKDHFPRFADWAKSKKV